MQDFRAYLNARLTPEKIKALEQKAQLKIDAIKRNAVLEEARFTAMQQIVAANINYYIQNTKTNFEELVALTGISASLMNRIRKGQANITLKTFNHLATSLEFSPTEFLAGNYEAANH